MEQSQLNNTSEKPELSFFTKLIGTGFFSGYSPFASGTVGSAVGLVFFLIPYFHSPYIIIPATAILFFIGGITADK